jgi:hypothetical protein
MSINSVAFNDPVLNFFKAVETARQRNIAAFNQLQPAAKFEMPAPPHVQKSASAVPLNGQSKHVVTGVNTAPAASAQGSQTARMKILGNYFDAYA